MDKHQILKQLHVWTDIISSEYPSATVKRFAHLLDMCRSELKPLFDTFSWEDQLWIMIQEPNPVWYDLLDSEQQSAYKLIHD